LVEEQKSGFDSINVNKAAIQSLVVSPKLTSYSENLVIGTSIADLTMESLEKPITINYISLTCDKLPVFSVIKPVNSRLEAVAASSAAVQNSLAIMPKSWGDLTDEETDTTLEKELTFHLVENSSVCLDSQFLNLCPDKSVHTSNLMDMNDEMLVTVLTDTNIALTHSDAALRSVEI
jgi:hypothetical protein